ncbi:MAG TPA: hypothetical protein PLF22_10760 [Pseudomonadales bacterium]|nr:hypothetical protein [Pseudomonadales bacterium]
MIFDTSHHATWSEFHKDSEGAKTRYVAMTKAVADRASHHNNGQLRTRLFKPRPYPQLTVGTPASFKRTSKGFTYSWSLNPALGETVIYLPAGYVDAKYINNTGSEELLANCLIPVA